MWPLHRYLVEVVRSGFFVCFVLFVDRFILVAVDKHMDRMFCIILLLSLCFGQGLESYHCFMIFNTAAICVIALFKFDMSLPL